MKISVSLDNISTLRKVLFAFVLLTSYSVNAQELKTYDSTYVYAISTKDGAYLTGKVIESTPNYIVVKKKSGLEIKIPRENIEISRALRGLPNGQLGPVPHPSRYLYAPSAIPLKRGEGYVNMIYFLAYQAQYGITDNFSIGMTTTPIFMPSFINGKYGAKIKDKWYASGGFQVGKLWYADPNTLGLVFANTTYGDEEANVTLNLGYGFYSQSNEKLPIIEVSGLFRSTNKVSFVGELWVLLHQNKQPTVIGGPALRLGGSKKYFVDIGVLSLNLSLPNDVYDYQTNTYRTEQEYFSWWPIPFISLGWSF